MQESRETNRNDIVDHDDLCKIISNKLGISVESADQHLAFLVDWMEKCAAKDDVYSMIVPKIGTMYLNVTEANDLEKDLIDLRDVRGKKLNRNKIRVMEIYKKKVSEIREKYKGADGHKLHGDFVRIRNGFFRGKYKKIRELENFQNGGN